MMRASRLLNVLSSTVSEEEMESRLAVLQRSELFGAVPPNEQRILASMFEPVSFSAGEVICGEGDPADCVYVVAAGEVEVELADKWVAARVGAGGVVGEYGLFEARHRTATVIARTGVRGHKRIMQSRNTSTTMFLALAATLAASCHHGPSHHGPSDQGPSGHHAPAASQEVLTEAAIAAPIRANRTAAWEAALHELAGPRYEEYRASRTRFGLTSQTTFLQHTPMGDLALIHLTGPDVHRAFHAMSSSRDSLTRTGRRVLHAPSAATAA
jgi:hypothetical protein